MKTNSGTQKVRVTVLLLIAVGVLAIHPSIQQSGSVTSTVKSQEEGGRTKPSPTPAPAPAPKETPTSKRTATPARASRTNSSNARRTLPASFNNLAGIPFVLIPSGSFMMGLSGRADSSSDEKDRRPKHQVTIGQPFYMGRDAVTQGQWRAVMGSNPSHFRDCGRNCAVEQVSWNDTQTFISKLNQRNDGFKYRLPSEAEWEYACRAGVSNDDEFGAPSQANGFGVSEMEPNRSEWCEDWYHPNFEGAPNDGSPWLTGGLMNGRVLRAIGHDAQLRACANRAFNGDPGWSGYGPDEFLSGMIPPFGFRVIATRVR